MKREEAELLLSMKQDGELPPDKAVQLEAYLRDHPELAQRAAAWETLGKELESMKISADNDQRLDRFESHVYARLERGAAWILLSAGAALMLAGALFYLVRDFFFNDAIFLPVRLGGGFVLAGVCVLAVSIVRHRLATYHGDKYKGVVR
ncbi:MAG: hypothetical protein P9L99_15845 [Candidatus Lernaella stagnicola]|nr:hypothetical protein [Candidatus Lernaella stagnicola]